MINFCRIELHGFKSFADKVVINFNDGITGIVGPNGCGKSNISDAIRWVLGESSAKNVRGSIMTDVIFNGSTKRNPMHICEVSLVFNNENSIFPIRHEKEITVTRKIHRNKNKGSDYYINGITSTRQEIVSMLYDTGVGKEGYSIVEQGKVKDILSSKPEERRAIFEDAAGVRALRIDKEKSEKSLKETDSNIARCKDILLTTGEMLEPLRKMSEQAIAYIEVFEELKKLEINSYLYQRENSESVNKELYEKLEGLKKEKLSVENSIEKCSDEIKVANAKIVELDDLKLKLINDKNTMQLNIEGKRGNKNLLLERLKSITQQLHKAGADTEKAKFEIGEKSKQITQNSDKLSDISRKLTSVNGLIETYEKAKAEAQLEVETAQNIVYSGHDERGKLMEDITKISSGLSGFNTERNALTEKSLELDVNIKKAETEHTTFDREHETTRKSITDKAIELEKLNRNCGLCKRAASEAQNKKIELSGKVIDVAKYISTIEGQLKVYGDDGSDRGKLQSDRLRDPELAKRMIGVFSEIIKVEDKYEYAIEMLLGAVMHNVIVEDEDDAKFVLQYNLARKYPRVTILPISSMRPRGLDSMARGILRENGVLGIASDLVEYDARFSSIISSQLGSSVIVDTYDNAVVISKKYNRGARIVTLSGDMFLTSGAISGGSTKNNNSGLSKDKKIADCHKSLAQLKKQYQENKEDLGFLDAEIKENEANVDKLLSIINVKSLELNNDKNKLDRLNDDIVRAKNNLTIMNNDREMTRAKLENVEKKLSEYERSNLMLKNATNMTDMQFSDTKKKLDDGLIRVRELDDKIFTYKMEIKEYSNTFGNLTETNEALTQAIEFHNREIEYNQAQLQQLQADSTLIHEELDKVKMGIGEEVNEEIQQMDAKIKGVDLEKQSIIGDLETLNTKKEKLMVEQLGKVTTKIAREETRVEEILARFNEMETRIEDEYNLSEEEMLTLKIADFDYASTQPLVEKLKKKKAGYGNIDVTVIEEYRQSKAEYDAREEQLLDCYTTKAKLENLITNLTSQILSKFKAEFKKISENFEKVFVELFGGGQGKLTLIENKDDPLDFNIEIFAEPRGKKMQILSLLSGGERTLTAIAILFAILKMKPLPFCILDEIDADLDDSNVGLYSSYLNKFSEHTQFIVITHKKPTMEYCDQLYGVTMEENGVTKMFNIMLTQAVKLIESKK